MQLSQPPTSTDLFGEACRDCSIIREADHRIANHLALLASYVQLKAGELAGAPGGLPEAFQLLVENIHSQIDAIAGVHRSLATSGQSGPARLSEYLHEVCAPLRLLIADRIDLVEDFSTDGEVAAAQILPLTQVVAELITNAVKHAYPVGERGRIVVRCFLSAPGTAAIEVKDDGPGLPPSFDPSSDGNVGFQLMRALITQMGARIEFQSRRDLRPNLGGRGLRARVTLSTAPAQQAAGSAQ